MTEQFLCGGFLHLDVGKEFLAGILQAGAEKIDHIVDDEEAVVVTLGGTYINRRILLVVSLDVELLHVAQVALNVDLRYNLLINIALKLC